MRKIRVFFEEDPSLTEIEVRVRAPEKDGETENLIARISGEAPEALVVTGEDGALIRLLPDEIVSVSVSGKFVQIITEEKRCVVRQPLQTFEEKLGSGNFVRISRYEIVNLDKVLKFDFTLGGTLRLELAGGMETWASRRNIPQIRKKLMEGAK